MSDNKIVIKGKRVLPFEQIDAVHKKPDGSTKMIFDLLENSLKRDTDYVQNGRKVFLTLSGYVLVSNVLCTGAEDQNDARREILNNYFSPETETTVQKNPFEIIREQLNIIENGPDAAKSEPAVDPGRYSDEKRAVMKKKIQVSCAIKDKVKDEEADSWIVEMQRMVKEVVEKSNGEYKFLGVLNSIYKEMTKSYGFVEETCRSEFVDKYGLSDNPSILRAISDNETWKSIFQALLKDKVEEVLNKE